MAAKPKNILFILNLTPIFFFFFFVESNKLLNYKENLKIFIKLNLKKNF